MATDEELICHRRRRDTSGLPADAFVIFEDHESNRRRQLEDFLEQQRQENGRLRELIISIAPNHKSSRVVNEGQRIPKGHRNPTGETVLNPRSEHIREDLEKERARERDLKAELAKKRELLDEDRTRKESSLRGKCTEVYEAVYTNHRETQTHLAELDRHMLDRKKENVRRLEQEELRRNAEEARRVRKEEEQRQFKELLLKMSVDQEEDRRIAEEERHRAKDRPRLEGIIAQLRQQNAEQRQLLVSLLDEYCNAGKDQSHEIFEAVNPS
ncbi:hypothetical protein FRC19_004347 [Serendipita sp. 401]|nr:hypothetical protein FRC16_004425 [Serendipita sp. 398]KAG8810738.1 hypothetical protein FRC19_004347 [Serendipita sp. 401]KAG9038616.1 hypothetical protein FS842_003251 [Serendipita sp. 407]